MSVGILELDTPEFTGLISSSKTRGTPGTMWFAVVKTAIGVGLILDWLANSSHLVIAQGDVYGFEDEFNNTTIQYLNVGVLMASNLGGGSLQKGKFILKLNNCVLVCVSQIRHSIWSDVVQPLISPWKR